MVKPLEKYTDKELDEKIREWEKEIREEKSVTNSEQDERNKNLIEVIKKKEDFLKQLLAERERRRGKK
jgi:hypothetical protein